VGTEPEGLRDFVAAVSPGLLRTAFLLTGDLASAEDVVQAALVKTWRHWSKVQAAGQPESYVRRILLNEFLGTRRRRWSGEAATGDVGDSAVEDAGFATVDDRSQLRAALDDLPRGQRAVVVLRYFDDLTEQQTAEVLGTSVGTVKSQCARALRRMRVTLEGELSKEAR
jgi:RNA polymerase sigma-70 factor (sigma-E family)